MSANDKTARTLSLDEIVTKLPEVLDTGKDLLEKRQLGKELLARYNYESNDWEKYAFFDAPKVPGAKLKYTRNLVYEDDGCRLLILCWPKGVLTPIHNHPEDGCWVTMLNGDLTEKTYDTSLKSNGEKNLAPGGITWMHDSIGYHQIGNFSEKPAVSLHLYAPKSLTSVVFDSEGVGREVGYDLFSKFGEKVIADAAH